MYHHKDAIHVKQAFAADEVLPPFEVEALSKAVGGGKEGGASSAANELRGIIQVFKNSESNVIRPVFTKLVLAEPVLASSEQLKSEQSKFIETKPVETSLSKSSLLKSSLLKSSLLKPSLLKKNLLRCHLLQQSRRFPPQKQHCKQ